MESKQIHNIYLAIEREYNQKRKEFQEYDKEYRMKLRDLRAQCPHVNTSFETDPSGNNDSCHQCDDCGKEL